MDECDANELMYAQTVALEAEFQAEQEAVEEANEQLEALRDAQFREAMEEKYPYLKGWK